MDTRKWITLMAVMLFLGAFSPAEACRCIMNHLQHSYCNSDVACKLKFLAATTRIVPSSHAMEKGYKVQVEKILRGEVALKSVTFIGTMAGTDCEYFHPSTDMHRDYFITASNNNGSMKVSSCSYIVRWDELSKKQKKGVEGAYNKGCPCDIVSCASQPCSTPQKTCALGEYNGGEAEKELKHQACVPINNTTCKWTAIQ